MKAYWLTAHEVRWLVAADPRPAPHRRVFHNSLSCALTSGSRHVVPLIYLCRIRALFASCVAVKRVRGAICLGWRTMESVALFPLYGSRKGSGERSKLLLQYLPKQSLSLAAACTCMSVCVCGGGSLSI